MGLLTPFNVEFRRSDLGEAPRHILCPRDKKSQM